jgi:vitamin K-dependent gamma-carboxylase
MGSETLARQWRDLRIAASRVTDAGYRPVSAASLAVFRIAFGLAMIYNTLLYLPWRVQAYYIDPSFHFPYEPFTFVQPVPGWGMYLVYGGMILTGGLIALGLWYRLAAAAFFVLTTYVFLLDSSYYQNHEYLISLLAFLMILLPAHCMWSIDAKLRPGITSPTVSAWVVWLLRFQVGVPYFFGGIAKLNADWLRGDPLRMWLERRTDMAIIGPFFQYDAVTWTMVYGSLVFDLAVVWFLLYHRTRIAAFVVATAFHLLNARLWGLFIFPWLMIAATTIFFSPDWPLKVRERWQAFRGRIHQQRPASESPPVVTGTRFGPVLMAFLVVWVAVQVLVPFRHFTMPGKVHWTEQGHRFAWHMMLREKSGSATFVVLTNGEFTEIDARDYLGERQASRMAGHPERLLQFARHLSKLHDGAEVRVQTSVSLNGRRHQPLIDPDVDLASASMPRWGRAEWILPLEQPLRGD